MRGPGGRAWARESLRTRTSSGDALGHRGLRRRSADSRRDRAELHRAASPPCGRPGQADIRREDLDGAGPIRGPGGQFARDRRRPRRSTAVRRCGQRGCHVHRGYRVREHSAIEIASTSSSRLKRRRASVGRRAPAEPLFPKARLGRPSLPLGGEILRDVGASEALVCRLVASVRQRFRLPALGPAPAKNSVRP